MYKYTYPYRYATQKLASALTPTIVTLKHTRTVSHDTKPGKSKDRGDQKPHQQSKPHRYDIVHWY